MATHRAPKRRERDVPSDEISEMDDVFPLQPPGGVSSNDTSEAFRYESGTKEKSLYPEDFFNPSSPQASTPRVPAAELRSRARLLVSNIFSNWNLLNNILERYEGQIGKRWTKKSKQARKELLLEVWPDMPLVHRPDFRDYYKSRGTLNPFVLPTDPTRWPKASEVIIDTTVMPKIVRPGDPFKMVISEEPYRFPFINIEDLTYRRSFLIFVNLRGRNPPSTFALVDWNASRLGISTCRIGLQTTEGCSMLMFGDTEDTYGRLVKTTDAQEAWLAKTGLHFSPDQGLMTLENHRRIIEFLAHCCTLILHDISLDTLPPQLTPALPVAPCISIDAPQLPSMRTFIAENPYRLPGELNLARLLEIVGAKRAATEDHIWALREDPGYFHDTLGEWHEHQEERLLDENGQQDPVLGSTSYWDITLRLLVRASFDRLITWNTLYQQIRSLDELGKKYPEPIAPGQVLPHEYLVALADFHTYLGTATSLFKSSFAPLAIYGPPLRSQFRKNNSVPMFGKSQIIWKVPRGFPDEAKYLVALLTEMGKNQFSTMVNLSDMVDEIDRLMQDSANQKLVSSYTANVLSDLGVFADTRNEFHLFEPWGLSMGYLVDICQEEIFSHFDESSKPHIELIEGLRDLKVSHFGKLTHGRFYYPSEKRTEQSVESMQKAEKELDMFWLAVDNHFKQNMQGKGIWKYHEKYFTQDREIERTPDWVEPPSSCLRAPSIESPDSGVTIPLQDLNIQPEKFVAPVPKTKAKTRTLKQTSASNTEQVSKPQLSPQQPHHTIGVNKRVMKVISLLFFNPSQNSAPGEIPWHEFTYSMGRLGFVAQKLGSSAWQFTPSTGASLDVPRGIQFHEPHPSGKLSFRNARQIGRRLNKTFGWDRETFVLI